MTARTSFEDLCKIVDAIYVDYGADACWENFEPANEEVDRQIVLHGWTLAEWHSALADAVIGKPKISPVDPGREAYEREKSFAPWLPEWHTLTPRTQGFWSISNSR